MKIALLQLVVGNQSTANVNNAVESIKEVKAKNPDLKLAILPECFNGPYGTEYFSQYAEKVPEGPTSQALAKLANDIGIYIIGGSIIELAESDKLCNTCTVWSPEGRLIGKHRKMHMFDTNFNSDENGSIYFMESSTLTAGNEFTVVEIENRKFGIGICHDLRFDELARIYRNEDSLSNHHSATMKIALLQLVVGNQSTANVNNAVESIKEVKAKNPDLKLAILPECFNGPYGTEYFSQYAEKVPEGPTSQALAKLANDIGIYIIGGSIIELAESDKLCNTCTVWSPEGRLIGKHRKMHMFDTNFNSDENGSIYFMESSTLTAGNEFTVVEIENRKFGIGICHDLRFDELARIYRNEGCDMIVYPSSFCMAHGPMHWELLQRSRANDNQLFVVTVAAARDTNADYVSYGHSMVVDPWGRVMHEAHENQDIIVADIDFSMVDEVRMQIPIFQQRRTDLYNTIKK